MKRIKSPVAIKALNKIAAEKPKIIEHIRAQKPLSELREQGIHLVIPK
jgi:hypothetical protein